MAARLMPGDKAKLDLIRKGKRTSVIVTAGKMPDSTRVARLKKPAEMSEKLGIEGQDLTPEVARKIGAQTTKGVVIAKVKPGSPADKAGLRRGDVIIEANQKAVENVGDLTAALKQKKNQGTLFLIERRGATRYVVIDGLG